MASRRLKDLLAARGTTAMEVMVEAGERVAAPHQRAASPVLSVADGEVEVGEGNASGGEDPVTSEVTGGSIRGEVRDVRPPVVPEANTKVDQAGECLVGRSISRSSSGRERIPVGKVPSYGSTIRLYSVMIEDGNHEDLELPQLRELLRASGMKLSCRKRKQDLPVSWGGVKGPPSTRQKVDPSDVSTRHAASQQTGSGPDVSKEAETSCNSSDFTKETPSDPCVSVKAIELPPSSGDLAVPEESITYLFSVYNFLRSFSVQLFLSPFGLDDFVAAINCTVQNNLLDAVHVSLLRALRWNLETKSAEGSQLASNCLKYLDWTLLEVLTWPTFLLEYLCVMGCVKNLGGQTFARNFLAAEYYTLPIVMKLKVLQILCDHVSDSEGYNKKMEEMEYEIVSGVLLESGSRPDLPSAAKASTYKRIRINAIVTNASRNGNFGDCRICGMGGTLVRCEVCPWVYHSRCIGLNKAFLPQEKWFCPECVVDKLGTTLSRTECGVRGDQIFGIDVCRRLFLGSCNYLLVIGTSSNAESYARYYNHYDVVKVLRLLTPSDPYTDICRRMMEYWKNLRDIFHLERLKIGKEVCRQSLSAQNSIQNAPINGASGPSTLSHHNGPIVSGVSKMALMQPAQSLFRVLSTSDSGLDGISREDTVSIRSQNSESLCPSHQSEHHLELIAERSGTVSGDKPARLSYFKPQAYMNLYTHGSIAVSAAASLAALKSEEGRVSPLQMVTNPRKKIAADSALQLKAFSSAAMQFVWPSTQKKLMEVPRDRCGWCLACKSSATGNKKACFLNMAAANAAKGSARILSDMHLIQNSDSHFTSIVAYLANMEESLRGLLVGSLQDVKQKQRWHKQLQEASNCRTVAPLLLELESNIGGVAFYSSWSKLIDDWSVEPPGLSPPMSRHASYQKYGAGDMATADDESWTWWSGGNISKRILQRGSHPSSIIRKAARQGGKKRIASISYNEGSNLPRQTRQSAWRGFVGLSQNSSQLALQVRYLDANIRWKEFVPPDQIPSGGKGPDVDFYAFRNAVICDRKIVDNRIRYALMFPNQNLLDVHLRANILEMEDNQYKNIFTPKNQSKNIKLWFFENHVPLYMVREFGQKAGVSSLSVQGMLDGNCFTNFYPRRVKAFIGDVFSYLLQKGDVYPCTTCKKDVPFRDIVKCSSCQGNCHKECTSSSVDSNINKGSHAVSSLICKLCLQKQSIMLTRYNTNASYVRLQQKIPGQQPVADSKVIFKFGSSQSAEPAVKFNGKPVTKVQVQSYMNSYAQPIKTVKVEAQPTAKMKASPFTSMTIPNIPSAQTGPRTKGLFAYGPGNPASPRQRSQALNFEPLGLQSLPGAGSKHQGLNQAPPKTKRSKSDKTRKRKNVQSITYFGLVWKKTKNDNDGRHFRENNIIRKSKDGIGLVVKPICCLCNKSYSPDFLYVRCEKCKNWFHGDALQLVEEEAIELVAYCCCRCRKRAMPHCPHSDDNTNPEPEINKHYVATSSQSTILSGEETSASPDQKDPHRTSSGVVEQIVKETMDAGLPTNMAC